MCGIHADTCTYVANDEHFVLAVTFAWVHSEVARLEASLVSWSLGGIPVLICAERVVASVGTVHVFLTRQCNWTICGVECEYSAH